MTLCVCLDNQNGMHFNHRRQSRDRVLYERLVAHCRDGGRLFIREDARILFPTASVTVLPDMAALPETTERDILFSEALSFLPPKDIIDRLIVYRWNRDYPSDCRFPLADYALVLCEKSDFVGFSHEKITEEVYRR